MARPSRGSLLVLVAALTLTACTRPENATSDTAAPPPATDGDTATTTDPTPPTTPTTTAPSATTDTGPITSPTTSAPPGTTTPDTTTPPPTTPTETTAAPAVTTVAPVPLDDFTLIFDGIVPFRFGDRDVDVVPGLSAEFGEPVSDEMAEYPTAEEGLFLDASGETSFVAPFGRTVCFANSLCVFFGAGAPETLILTGWRLRDDAPSDLSTRDGITAGSVLADHADIITFDPAISCDDLAFGAVDGIDVYLSSADGPFATPAASGDGLEILDPDPALVTVSEMRAGELPRDIFGDC